MARHRTRQATGPIITDSIVVDRDLLGDAIDSITVANPELQKLNRRIVRLQNQLRGVLSGPQWGVFMLLEEASNLRGAVAVNLVAKAFYRAGRRAGRRSK